MVNHPVYITIKSNSKHIFVVELQSNKRLEFIEFDLHDNHFLDNFMYDSIVEFETMSTNLVWVYS